MDDLGSLMGGVIGPLMMGPPPRIGRTTVNGYIISTVDSYDQGPETAVIDAEGTYILERYDTEKKAKAGHKKWAKKAEKFKKGFKVVDIGYGSLVDQETIVLDSPPTNLKED